MRHHRSVLAWLGLAAATVTVAVLVRRALAPRPAPVSSAESPLLTWNDAEDEPAPDSSVLEPAPASYRDLSAQPRDFARRPAAPEDAEAIGADDLGAAFLARATGYDAQEEVEDDEELAGFQILDGWR